MEKTKCPNCGEMVEPKVYPLGYGYSAVCTSCGYTTQEEFSKEAALRRFGVSRVFHANKVEAASNCFKEKSSKAYKKKEGNSMEDLTGASEVLDKLLQDEYREGFLAGNKRGKEEAYLVAYAAAKNHSNAFLKDMVRYLGYDPENED